MDKLKKLMNTAEIAERYFSIKKPGHYTRTSAVKQFPRERNKDKKLIARIIRQIAREALSIIDQ